MAEQWKPISQIPGYESLTNYEININGDLRNIGKGHGIRTGAILKWSINNGGYYYTKLRVDGKQKNIMKHCLIAMLYIPNPQNLPFVDHKNGLRLDNSIDNLRWVTRSQNNQNSVGCGRTGHKCIFDTDGDYPYWYVQVMLNGEKVAYKSFKKLDGEITPPDEVIKYRDEMLLLHNGEFARI